MKKSLLKKTVLTTAIFLASCFGVNQLYNPSTTEGIKVYAAQRMPPGGHAKLGDKLGEYYTTDEYEKKINDIAKENPKITSLEKIGESWQGRVIYALKISDEDLVKDKAIEDSFFYKLKKWHYKFNTPKKKELREPQILILAHQHARELISGMTAIATAEYLTKNYNIDEKVKSYVDNNEIYIIPLANPDGLAIIEGSQKQVIDPEKAKEYLEDPLYMFDPSQPEHKIDVDTKLEETRWRKNARDNNGDGIILAHDGVDLNRNYSTGWAEPAEDSQYKGNYPGPAPFSEPETKAIKKLVERLDNLVIAVDLHNYAGIILHPPGYKMGESKDEKLFKKIAEEMIKKQPYEKYDITKFNEFYSKPIGGAFLDWIYTEHNALSFLIEVYKKELGYLPDAANFNPLQQDIKKVTENVIPMLLYLFEISDNPQKVLKENFINPLKET